MSNHWNSIAPGRNFIHRLLMVMVLMGGAFFARAETITNLQQLTTLLNLFPQTNCAVRLEVTVCAVSQPEKGVLIVQDGSGVELLELGNFEREIHPGERILIQGDHCLLRKRDIGIQISASPVLLNSPADIVVLSQPSWWTLPRLLIFTGLLVVVLAVAAIWITQLRRLVEQRTRQLRGEIHERERAEHQRALEAERARIARDLHDYLGSAITEIRVLASTGQRPESDEATHQKLFHNIVGKARSLISALDVIVWAVDPEDNSLQSLGDYLTGYTEEFFSHTNTACRFKVPVAFPQITLDGRVRHELLLAVKETLNNIVRHADATEVEFSMVVAGGRLEIEIADNGKGFEGSGDGHGLNNLSARLLKLGGTCVVASSIGGGTTVRIHLPLPEFTATKTASAKN